MTDVHSWFNRDFVGWLRALLLTSLLPVLCRSNAAFGGQVADLLLAPPCPGRRTSGRVALTCAFLAVCFFSVALRRPTVVRLLLLAVARSWRGSEAAETRYISARCAPGFAGEKGDRPAQ